MKALRFQEALEKSSAQFRLSHQPMHIIYTKNQELKTVKTNIGAFSTEDERKKKVTRAFREAMKISARVS